MTPSEFDKALEAAEFVRGRAPLVVPRVGLILGSGLGAFAEALEDSTTIPFKEIPHFPLSTAIGHSGRLVLGRCRGVPVAVLQGRAHYYEGYSLREVVLPVRALGVLGVKLLVVTNAAGGINRKLRARGFLLIRDHLNLQGSNPLLGPNEERFGPRFPDMTEAYSKKLRAIAKREARSLRLPLFEGVYAAMRGPSYETPSEVRALARLGADVVGMSTAPEVIAARHLGMQVLGLSLVTNMAAGLSKKEISHDEVLEAGERMASRLTAFLRALIPALAREGE
ncbi:purine-nucleoside phosphorylase [Acidobacteriia bacterium AH_259_A11_L15]|nr:purine-nucleoside phosphorylase [Acidobacteriia bacterium AH_259_A11_L15]